MKINKEKTILIPHLHYKVHLKDSRKAKGEVKDFLKTYIACAQELNRHESIIWTQMPVKEHDIPTIAHELIHVLQNICKWHHIDFIEEKEHCAYLFNFMFNEMIGYTFVYPE